MMDWMDEWMEHICHRREGDTRDRLVKIWKLRVSGRGGRLCKTPIPSLSLSLSLTLHSHQKSSRPFLRFPLPPSVIPHNTTRLFLPPSPFTSSPSSPLLSSPTLKSKLTQMGTCMSLSKDPMLEASLGGGGGSGRSSKRWRKWVGNSESGRGGLFDRSEKKARSSRRFGLWGTRSNEEEDIINRVQQQQGKRMVLNGAMGAACLFTQQGRKGSNQDAMVVWEDFASREDTIFCGVFDGHGPYGHMVAKKVRDSLPAKVCNQWKAISDANNVTNQNGTLESMNPEDYAFVNLDDEWVEFQENGESEKFPEVYTTLRQSLLKAFKSMDKELKLHPTIDCFCSGSTTVALIKQGRDLIIGNIGDSRAVLGTRDRNNALVATQLTVDLKPNLPRESARIQQCKGRVFALQDEPEVPRVWLPNSDSPGLAMARAFGDFCLKDYGLISVPDISYRKLSDHDEFIILATDGVWDVLSNKEVVDIVASAPTRSIAARTLVDCATREWKVKFPTSKIDDCAVICLFIKRASLVGQGQVMGSLQMPKECPETTDVGATYQDADVHDMHQLPDGPQLQGNAMQEMFPPVGVDETEPIDGLKDDTLLENCHSVESLKEGIYEEEWTALDGVTRVNTLLNLPRFQSDDARLAGQSN